MYRFNLLAGLLALLLPYGLVAQSNLFLGVSFEHEVTRRYGYLVQIDHRQQVETGKENRVLLLGAINRKLAKNLDLTPGIRFTPRYDADRPDELRLFTDLNYRLSLGDSPLSLEGRLRLQHERQFVESGSTGSSAARPRLGLAFAPNPFLDLVAEYEARFRSDVPKSYSRHRWTFGLEQDLTSGLSFELFYRLERRLNTTPPDTEPTYGFYLNYLLPDRRDRAWKYRRPFGRYLSW